MPLIGDSMLQHLESSRDRKDIEDHNQVIEYQSFVETSV